MQVPENMAGSGFPRVWLAAENPGCVCAGSPVRDRLFKRTEWFQTDDRGPWPVTAAELVPPSPWIAGVLLSKDRGLYSSKGFVSMSLECGL